MMSKLENLNLDWLILGRVVVLVLVVEVVLGVVIIGTNPNSSLGMLKDEFCAAGFAVVVLVAAVAINLGPGSPPLGLTANPGPL